MLLRLNDIGAEVGNLQRRLYTIGYTKVEQTNVYDQGTVGAVKQLQARGRLVVDGIYGPKTEALVKGVETGTLLKQVDIVAAAAKLGVDVASVMAVNEVESVGSGFVKAECPKILFERHVFWRQLVARSIDPVPLEKKYPGIVSQKRGGYAGGASEYTRLSVARQINQDAAYEACSWGLFQVMGYHWESLGFTSVTDFVSYNSKNEGNQLDTFVRFILADANLQKALKARKWSAFARAYNGPAYAENLYDVKMERAYARYVEAFKDAA